MRRIRIGKNDEIVKCPKCKGTGLEPSDMAEAVFTFGISFILESIDPDDCEYCGGEGEVVIERR